MGRELILQLEAEACNVAMCDVSPTGLAETQRLCELAGLPQGLRVTTHIADVADRTQVEWEPARESDFSAPARQIRQQPSLAICQRFSITDI